MDTTRSRSARPRPLRVVIAGGGVAGLEAALTLRELAGERVEIELLAPEPHFWHRPLAVIEPFEPGRLRGVELAELAGELRARFTLGSLVRVVADSRIAVTSAGAEIPYDALVVARGARPEVAIPGALTFRGPADVEAFGEILARVAARETRRLVFAVPGGPVWPLPLYELALLTANFAARQGLHPLRIALVTPEHRPLAGLGDRAAAEAGRLLEKSGVTVYPGRYPLAARPGVLALTPGGSLAADEVVALPRLRGDPVEGVPHDALGFLPVGKSGRVTGMERVFAAGDATASRLKQGSLAAGQGGAVAEAIAALAGVNVVRRVARPALPDLLLSPPGAIAGSRLLAYVGARGAR